MAFVNLKPGTLLAPVPAALITSGAERGGRIVRNLMTAAWVGTVCSDPPMVSVSIRPSRFTCDLVEESGEFVVCLTDKKLLRATDYCGVRSGRDEDKFAACSLTPVPAEGMKYAPALAEAPVYLACRVRNRLELGSHIMYVGETVGMGVREDLVDHQGAVHTENAGLISYTHGLYQETGKALGFFGFSVADPKVRARRMAAIRESAGKGKAEGKAAGSRPAPGRKKKDR